MKRYFSIIASLFVAFVLGIHAMSAQDGLRGALLHAGRLHPGATSLSPDLAAADFDHDSQPDGAVLSQAGFLDGQRLFRIDVHITSGRNVTLTFSSAESALDITALDVNRDGAPDIVVERVFTHERVQVFLNDGYGVFESAAAESIPASNDSESLFRTGSNSQNVPVACLPPTRGHELTGVQSGAVPFAHDTRTAQFWPEVLPAQCAARAPSASRAPPSFFLL